MQHSHSKLGAQPTSLSAPWARFCRTSRSVFVLSPHLSLDLFELKVTVSVMAFDANPETPNGNRQVRPREQFLLNFEA